PPWPQTVAAVARLPWTTAPPAPRRWSLARRPRAATAPRPRRWRQRAACGTPRGSSRSGRTSRNRVPRLRAPRRALARGLAPVPGGLRHREPEEAATRGGAGGRVRPPARHVRLRPGPGGAADLPGPRGRWGWPGRRSHPGSPGGGRDHTGGPGRLRGLEPHAPVPRLQGRRGAAEGGRGGTEPARAPQPALRGAGRPLRCGARVAEGGRPGAHRHRRLQLHRRGRGVGLLRELPVQGARPAAGLRAVLRVEVPRGAVHGLPRGDLRLLPGLPPVDLRGQRARGVPGGRPARAAGPFPRRRRAARGGRRGGARRARALPFGGRPVPQLRERAAGGGRLEGAGEGRARGAEARVPRGRPAGLPARAPRRGHRAALAWRRVGASRCCVRAAPKPVDTRYVGSWVCPCLGCAVAMVSQWMALLTAELPEAEPGDPAAAREGAPRPCARPKRVLPQTITVNLDSGMTAEEQLGYELGDLGVAPDRSERRFCRERSSRACAVCAAAAALRAEESLFFGRLPAVLAPVAGDAAAAPAAWREPPRPDDGSGRFEALAARAAARGLPSAHLGKEYSDTVVPAVPALDWEPQDPRQAEGGAGSGAAVWPPELAAMPLLKIPPSLPAAGAPSALDGVASGVRSALTKVRGSWWRLKGCGNREDGFPVETCGDRGERSVRGCCFPHCVLTELRVTLLAADALATAGLDCANRPAGLYRYLSDPAWPLPRIERCCAVFETIGNARLGDHLVAGLLRLAPSLLPEPSDGFGALRAAVAAGRGLEAAGTEDLWPTATVTSCGMPTADAASKLSSSGSALEEVPPRPAAACADQLPEALAGTWDAARAGLAARLGPAKEAAGEPSLLLWLAWRLGWECGATVRALHGAGIAWGTYADAMGIHCNAHANNLVVKPPWSGRPCTFLAALDFDMAFTRDGFLPAAAAKEAAAAGMGLHTFEGVLSFEANMGMKMVLGGSDFASTGVANEAPVPSSHAVVEMALRDTLVTAYDAALQGGVDSHPHQTAMREAACYLIKLALCLTTHVEG
ncbi:unnamed protein product, partial [Prorocentrum cordatum]